MHLTNPGEEASITIVQQALVVPDRALVVVSLLVRVINTTALHRRKTVDHLILTSSLLRTPVCLVWGRRQMKIHLAVKFLGEARCFTDLSYVILILPRDPQV